MVRVNQEVSGFLQVAWSFSTAGAPSVDAARVKCLLNDKWALERS